MKFKKLSALLACAMVFMIPAQSNAIAADETVPVTVIADETESVARAAGLISTYTLSCSAGTKKLYITGATRGTGKMAKIGFKFIKIDRSSDKVNWTYETTAGDKISNDTDYKSLSKYGVDVQGGYYYRVTLYHYAKEDKLLFPEEQSVFNTSNIVWVPAK